MRISDWSSDVCSSDLLAVILFGPGQRGPALAPDRLPEIEAFRPAFGGLVIIIVEIESLGNLLLEELPHLGAPGAQFGRVVGNKIYHRSEEHTSELQSLMRISYAVFCLKKKKLS